MKKVLITLVLGLVGTLYAGEKVDETNSERNEVAKAIFIVCGTEATDDEVVMVASVLKNRTKEKDIRNEATMKASVKKLQMSMSFAETYRHQDLIKVADMLASGERIDDKEIMKRWDLCWKYSTANFKPTTKALMFIPISDTLSKGVIKVEKTKNFYFIIDWKERK